MKEPIVYLPDQIDIGHGDITYLRSQDVYTALDAAGVKWVQETPEEYKIRMMSLQIEELKDVCTKLQAQLKEAQAENGSLAGLLADTQKHVDELYAKDEELKRAYVELQDQHIELRNVCTTLEDQNAALKMSARTVYEELKSIRGEGKP